MAEQKTLEERFGEAIQNRETFYEIGYPNDVIAFLKERFEELTANAEDGRVSVDVDIGYATFQLFETVVTVKHDRQNFDLVCTKSLTLSNDSESKEFKRIPYIDKLRRHHMNKRIADEIFAEGFAEILNDDLSAYQEGAGLL